VVLKWKGGRGGVSPDGTGFGLLHRHRRRSWPEDSTVGALVEKFAKQSMYHLVKLLVG
jgi:hypothetical protein